VVADALSRKSRGIVSCMQCTGVDFIRDMKLIGAELMISKTDAMIARFQVRPILIDRIRELQASDAKLLQLRDDVLAGKSEEFRIRDDGILCLRTRMCVPSDVELKKEILTEAHSSAYAMHPGSTKMYRTIKEHYWWPGMKREVAEFVARCLVCQQVKVEHQ